MGPILFVRGRAFPSPTDFVYPSFNDTSSLTFVGDSATTSCEEGKKVRSALHRTFFGDILQGAVGGGLLSACLCSGVLVNCRGTPWCAVCRCQTRAHSCSYVAASVSNKTRHCRWCWRDSWIIGKLHAACSDFLHTNRLSPNQPCSHFQLEKMTERVSYKTVTNDPRDSAYVNKNTASFGHRLHYGEDPDVCDVRLRYALTPTLPSPLPFCSASLSHFTFFQIDAIPTL
jgi:hypothetical protein